MQIKLSGSFLEADQLEDSGKRLEPCHDSYAAAEQKLAVDSLPLPVG